MRVSNKILLAGVLTTTLVIAVFAWQVKGQLKLVTRVKNPAKPPISLRWQDSKVQPLPRVQKVQLLGTFNARLRQASRNYLELKRQSSKPTLNVELRGDMMTVTNIRPPAKGAASQFSLALNHLQSLLLSGSNNVDVQLRGQQFALYTMGNNEVKLHGHVKNLSIATQGQATIDATQCQADHIKIVSTGYYQIKVFARRQLTVHLYGAGEVRYIGHPNITRKVMGSVDIAPLKDHRVQ